MKLSKTLLASAVALFASASAALAATYQINIVGATAFRAAAHTTILNTLGAGTRYGFTIKASSDQFTLSGAKYAIFVKDGYPAVGDTTIVRTSWSGSAEGIELLTSGANGSFLSLSYDQGTITTSGTDLGEEGSSSRISALPQVAFSDVLQSSTRFTSPSLSGGPVGVIPFLFVASESAPAGITNITDQQFIRLSVAGIVPASLLTGNVADANNLVVATGRDSLSGTRTTAFAETGLGIFTGVQQYKATVSGGIADIGTLELFSEAEDLGVPVNERAEGNGGYNSGSNLRALLAAESNDDTISFIGYLGVSDANNAISNGGRALTYNGVAYSENNVKNGSYTFWGYEQLYRIQSLSGQELAFFNALTSNIPANLGTAGIKIADLQVIRSGDGGPIFPK